VFRRNMSGVIFIEWWLVIQFCIVLLMVAVGAFGFWLVRKKKWPIRVPLRIVSALVALAGAFGVAVLCALNWGPLNPNTYSTPLYSPNGKMAARIHEYNASGFGGADSSVELFTARGFRSGAAFSGEYQSVKQIRWIDDRHLLISYYDHSEYPHPCVSRVFDVDVVCDRVPLPQAKLRRASVMSRRSSWR
jgi:hypothetical protein